MPLTHEREARRGQYSALLHVLVGACTLSPAVLWGGTRAPAQERTYTVIPAGASMTVPPSSSQPTHRDGSRVTLTVQDSTVEYVVTEIARQAHLRPVYNNHNPAFAKRVTLRLANASAPDALAAALQGTGLEAKLASDGETVVVRPRTTGAEQMRMAGGIVVGRVTDSASGAGLKGAAVRVEGVPKLSAVTTDSGNFTLRDVPVGDQVLQVRLFGYRPANRTVTIVDGERTTVRVALGPVPTVLSGVVTTATGVQRKVEVGNDITSINVDSVMRVAPVSNVTNLLETRVPGLTVQHTSGEPGNPSRIRLRGVSSVTGNNDPIIVVDGIRVYASQSDARNANLAGPYTGTSATPGVGTVPTDYAAPSPLDQIDPNSIERIDVFKGPSASALYGSDAANGVIVITTKHGRPGPTHWSLNFGQGINWLPGKWPIHYFKFGSDKDQNIKGQIYCQAFDPYCTVDSVVAFQALNDPRFSPFAHGHDQTAALTVSGGVPTLQYSLTGSAAGDVGNLKLPPWEQQHLEQRYGPVPGWMKRPDNYKTYGVSGQLTAQPTTTTRVTLSSSLFHSDQQQGSLQGALTQLEGEYISVAGDTALQRQNLPVSISNAIDPPLIQNDVERATASTVTSTNALTLAWQPWSWLPLSATGGLNTVQRVDETYIPFGIRASGLGPTGDTTGSYGLGRGTSEDKTLTLNTTLPSRWLTTAVGVNYHSGSTNDFSAHTNQLGPGVSKPTVFLYQNNTGPSLSSLSSSTYGWYVEPRLNFSSRFFVAPGFRLDGGSASGANGGFRGSGLTGLPKIDFSWLAIDRDQPRAMLDLLRPRVAFGVSGTQPAPDAKLRLLNVGGGQTVALNDTTLLPAVAISTLGNTALRPETSRELEGGLDAELWRGRLTLTWTQYNKTRYNAIIQVPVAQSVYADVSLGQGLGSGSSPVMQSVNLGVVRNTGTELTANATVLESRALGWNVGVNLSNDNNRVVRLAPGFTPNKSLGIVPGYPLFSQWAAPIASVVDLDHNGLIDPTEYTVKDSLVYAGQAEPKYQANLNTTLTLLNGRLSATATFAYQDGMTQNNLTALQSAGAALIPNAPGTSLSTQAAFLAAYCGTQSNNVVSLARVGFIRCGATPIGALQTVNTFRFNELSVNYTLPTGFTHWLRVPRAALALQGQNLGLHTNYRGIDPNVNAFSTAVTGGDQTADLGQLPQPRIWWLKLNLGN